MFAFLGKMFGSAEAGAAVINGVTHAVDEMFHTDQEEAQEKAQARTEGFNVYMEWLRSTSGSRIARRAIALLVTGIWAIEHIAAVSLEVASIFTNDTGALTATKFTEASSTLAGHAVANNALVGVVLLFYFGGPAAIDGVKGLVNKWSNKGEKNAQNN